ncbi:hypothetical protein [Nonomuraea sp. NPDC023979]|uniref:hypothetical protein n=1 Tax=Nonomuraea sp. NPDC023979 TaxID=3154796 RepID=UPI0033FBF758
MSDATNLTPAQIVVLHAEAYAQRSPFVDPAALRVVMSTHFHTEWAAAILGHPYQGWNHIANWEIVLLALALKAEPDRPTPAVVAERQERARREMEEAERARQVRYQAELDAWHVLRDRLPIKVTVGHNWTIGHWESGYVTGRDHIVAQEELRVGRLHRAVRQVLCETPSKTTSGRRNKDPLRGVDRRDDGEDRIPTCVACLRVAERIARPA